MRSFKSAARADLLTQRAALLAIEMADRLGGNLNRGTPNSICSQFHLGQVTT